MLRRLSSISHQVRRSYPAFAVSSLPVGCCEVALCALQALVSARCSLSRFRAKKVPAQESSFFDQVRPGRLDW